MKSQWSIILATAILVVASACSSDTPVTPAPTETLRPDVGRVFGTLQIRREQTTEPVTNTILYLAPTIKDTAGNEVMVGFERASSSKVVTDIQGRFVFQNIPPGNYGLVVDKIAFSYLLLKPDSEKAMLILVIAGKEVDLGTLVYDSLPLVTSPKAPPYP